VVFAVRYHNVASKPPALLKRYTCGLANAEEPSISVSCDNTPVPMTRRTIWKIERRDTKSPPLHAYIIFSFYHIIFVPVLPLSASSSLSIDVIMADSPPDSIKPTAASILGPILPGGNCPEAR
jgi:hypothetical protein